MAHKICLQLCMHFRGHCLCADGVGGLRETKIYNIAENRSDLSEQICYHTVLLTAVCSCEIKLE